MFLCRCRRSKVGSMGFIKLISQAFPRPLPQSPLVFFPLFRSLAFSLTPLSEHLEQARLPMIGDSLVTFKPSLVLSGHLMQRVQYKFRKPRKTDNQNL